jgi:hypothetical protein
MMIQLRGTDHYVDADQVAYLGVAGPEGNRDIPWRVLVDLKGGRTLVVPCESEAACRSLGHSIGRQLVEASARPTAGPGGAEER